MKYDLLTIHDDTYMLLMKVTRIKSLLYKINIKITSHYTQVGIGMKDFVGWDIQ